LEGSKNILMSHITEWGSSRVVRGDRKVTISITRDMCSEDVAFCKNLQDAGFDVVVNTTIRVGHEKTLII